MPVWEMQSSKIGCSPRKLICFVHHMQLYTIFNCFFAFITLIFLQEREQEGTDSKIEEYIGRLYYRHSSTIFIKLKN